MFIKFANASLLEARIAHRGDSLMRTAHRATFNYEPREGFLYVRSRAISSRTNDNFDTWPAEELRQAWATFIGKPVFVNHHNKDHRRARGVIIDAALHEDVAPDGTPDTWVEVLMEVDAVRFPKLAKAILAGDIERTSMGADVAESECSYCGNVASTPDRYCVHVSRHKGQRLLRRNPDGTQEDVLVHEICRKISFFENSLLVEAPADPTAFFLGVDDTGVRSMGMQMLGDGRSPITKIPRHKPFVKGASKMATVERIAWGEMKAPAVVDTLGLIECPVCGERSKFDSTGRCSVCGFMPPPEPFREPDLEVAQKADMRDGWINPDLMSAPAFTPPQEGDGEGDPVQSEVPPRQGAERTGGTRMRPSEVIVQQQAQQIAALRADNARLAHLAGIKRRADVNNPGQPVPEPAAQSGVSTEEARQPDATTDVTSGGSTLTDVGSDATTDLMNSGTVLPDVAPMATADVTAPVAGGAEPQSYEDSVTKVEPDASGGTETAPAFSGDNSWVQAVRTAQAQVFAALRLARLRIAAGIESGNDLAVAEKIASTVKPEAVRNEIVTLSQVVKNSSQQRPVARAPHVAQRSTPSLASQAVPGIQAVGGFAGLAVSADEVGLFD